MQKEAVTTADSCLALYGNSVFLAGIKAELSRRLVFELITIEAGCPNIVPVIRARKPRALIFDQTTSLPDFSMSLLYERPRLLLIGLDPSSDEMRVLSNTPAQALSITDLVRVIHQKESNSKLFKRR